MALRLVAGSANHPLAEAIAGALQVQLTPRVVERFPDGELRPVVASLRGADVYVVQPTGPPVNDHVVELMLLADACQRSGAERVTAVIPYFGYAPGPPQPGGPSGRRPGDRRGVGCRGGAAVDRR